MVRVKYVIPVLILVVCMTKPSYGKWVWNKETGWMQSTSAVATTLEQRYKYALSLIVEQKYVDAVKEFEAIIKTDPDSEYAEVSQINIGWAYFLNGDYKRAMKAYEGAFQKFSGTKRTKEILEKMYQVGIVQMDTDEDAAIEILEKVIQKQQLGPLAPEAQVKIADCYFKKNQFEEAIDAYEKFMENYPKNEWIPYIQYQIPLSKICHEKKQERNYGLLISAKENFEEYIVSNSNGVNVEDAKKMIEDIRILEAEREFNIGEFYIRRKKPSAAVMYFEYVMNRYPNTIWAEKANERIEFLRMIEAVK